MLSELSVFQQGLSTGAGLIIAIGAQNAFVLTQAIERNHALTVAGLCALLDALLIFAGVSGIGTLVANDPTLRAVAAVGGAGFLFWFGARSLRAAFTLRGREEGLAVAAGGRTALGATLAATLAVSLLNPHVYLDTVILLGAISGNYPGNGRWVFGAGAACMSVFWFFSLCFAGRRLAPVFRGPRAWQWLYSLVCLMVWWVGANLLYDWLRS